MALRFAEGSTPYEFLLTLRILNHGKIKCVVEGRAFLSFSSFLTYLPCFQVFCMSRFPFKLKWLLFG